MVLSNLGISNWIYRNKYKIKIYFPCFASKIKIKKILVINVSVPSMRGLPNGSQLHGITLRDNEMTRFYGNRVLLEGRQFFGIMFELCDSKSR